MYIGADQEERTVNPLSEMDEDEQTRVEQGKRLLIKGGQFGWVFEKKNEERRRKREEQRRLRKVMSVSILARGSLQEERPATTFQPPLQPNTTLRCLIHGAGHLRWRAT